MIPSVFCCNITKDLRWPGRRLVAICVASTFLLPIMWATGAPVRFIEPDKSSGTSRAVIVEASPLAHTAQMLPLDEDGKFVGKGDVAKQAQQVLQNIKAALKPAKSDLNRIVKLNVYVATNELTAAVGKVLANEFKGATKPAVTFVGGPLPQDALVAMDAVAVSDVVVDSVKKFQVESSSASPMAEVAILPGTASAIYVAGMADKNELREATRNTLEKLKGAISHFGLGTDDIVQLKAFLQPMSQVEVVEQEIKAFFGQEVPAPVVYVEWVSSGLPIEIELIAAGPSTANESDTVSYITPPGTTSAAVYSRVARINSGKRIYISGLYGASVPENDVKDIYGQLDDLLKKTGSDINHLVKATYYFSDPQSNGRLDALRPKIYDPKRPPSASKARVIDVGSPGKGIGIDMIAVTPK